MTESNDKSSRPSRPQFVVPSLAEAKAKMRSTRTALPSAYELAQQQKQQQQQQQQKQLRKNEMLKTRKMRMR